MCCSAKRFFITAIVAALLVFGLTWWYRHLPPRKQQFIQNLIRQAPDLPLRYMV
jgi:hypothetical protein